VPAVADGAKPIQSNRVRADERGFLYVIDRWGAGMNIVEYTG
jgi:hypothetical protein